VVSNINQQQQRQQPAQNAQTNQPEDPNQKKKGFFGKIFGALKDDKNKNKDSEKQNPPPTRTPQ